MSILEIVKYGDPILRKKTLEVTEITDEIKKLAKNMLETMYSAPGVGLAALQVGSSLKICVIDVVPNGRKRPFILINPQILSGENKIELERIHPINPFFSFVINVYAPEKYTEKEYGSNLLHRVGTITGMIKTKELKTNILLYNLLEQLDNGELMMNTSEENIYDCFIDEIKIKSDFSNTELLKYLWSSLPGLIEFIYGTKVRCIVTDPINDSEKIENKIENLIIELISDLGYVKFKNSTYWGINYMQPKNIIPEF